VWLASVVEASHTTLAPPGPIEGKPMYEVSIVLLLNTLFFSAMGIVVFFRKARLYREEISGAARRRIATSMWSVAAITLAAAIICRLSVGANDRFPHKAEYRSSRSVNDSLGGHDNSRTASAYAIGVAPMTASSRSTAKSISDSVMTNGDARRSVEPWVS